MSQQQESSVDQELEAVGGMDAPAHPQSSSRTDRARQRRRMGFQVVRWGRILVLPFAAILYWVGLWNFLDRYVLPQYSLSEGYAWRDALYIVSGMTGMFCLKLFWRQPSREIHAPFSWSFQMLRFLRLYLTVSAAIVFWTGCWNLFDTQVQTSALREICYMVVATVVLFLLDVFGNSKSLRYLLNIHATKEEAEQEDADDDDLGQWR